MRKEQNLYKMKRNTMNTLFESTWTISIDSLYTAYHVTYFKKQPAGTIISFTLAGLCTLSAVSNFISNFWVNDTETLLRTFVLIFLRLGIAVVTIWYPFWRTRKAAEATYKSHTSSFLPLEGTRVFTDESVTTIDEQASSTVYWYQFQDGYLYKDTIVLYVNSSVMSIPLSSLTKGTPEMFTAFIKSKVLLK